jgi:subtilase family serine protease
VVDVEMVHALAPDATLVILLLPTNSLDNTANTVSAAVGALRLGSTEGGVMSISAAAQIGGEHCVTRAQADASGHVNLGIVLRNGGRSMISNGGGTSASAPIWAALTALADQYAGRHLGFVNPAVYQIARGPSYHQAFHDITTGDNTAEFPPRTIAGYRAAPGWDPVTGWGSPDAQVLVPLLARYADA